MSRLPVALLWLSSLSFLVFGVLFAVDPERMTALVQLEASEPSARIEVRAMYGGLEVGIAAFLAWCALAPVRLRVGLMASGLLFLGLAMGRVCGIALDGSGAGLHWQLAAAETLACALSFWAAGRVRAYS